MKHQWRMYPAVNTNGTRQTGVEMYTGVSEDKNQGVNG